MDRIGQDIAALILAVLHNPVDDRSAVFKHDIGRAIASKITRANDGVAGGGGGDDVTALGLAALHDPIHDGAAIL